MDRNTLKDLLNKVKSGEVSLDYALQALVDFPLLPLANAHLDLHRELRNGFAEVVYAEGKSYEDLREISSRLLAQTGELLVTRLMPEQMDVLAQDFPDLKLERKARIAYCKNKQEFLGKIAVLAAGTSDLAVAEECRVSAEYYGLEVSPIYDVGVAGLHRVVNFLDEIRQQDLIIAVAGMEGALPGVVAGLVPVPVIAVPTSVGYGATFGGLTAFLSMLVSCSPGLTVVNIDNGFGAALAAAKIIRHLRQRGVGQTAALCKREAEK